MNRAFIRDSQLGVTEVSWSHQDSTWTFLPGRTIEFAWVATVDVHSTAAQASAAAPARFLSSTE